LSNSVLKSLVESINSIERNTIMIFRKNGVVLARQLLELEEAVPGCKFWQNTHDIDFGIINCHCEIDRVHVDGPFVGHYQAPLDQTMTIEPGQRLTIPKGDLHIPFPRGMKSKPN
jgi:hypothetical protein